MSESFLLLQTLTLVVTQELKQKKWTETKTKRLEYGQEEKWTFPRFLSFRFCPIVKIENSEISEIYLLLQILTEIIPQDSKTTKIWTEQKTERFWHDLKEKIKISKISKFLILSYTQNRKLKNLGNFVYLEFWHWL